MKYWELNTVISCWNQSANSVRVGVVIYVHVLEHSSKERFYFSVLCFEVAETNTLILVTCLQVCWTEIYLCSFQSNIRNWTTCIRLYTGLLFWLFAFKILDFSLSCKMDVVYCNMSFEFQKDVIFSLRCFNIPWFAKISIWFSSFFSSFFCVVPWVALRLA